MLKLIKNVEVYAPAYLGKKDILFGEPKIIDIADSIDVTGTNIEVIDGTNLKVMPGLIDNHVHFLGGGGEAGPQSRVPEIMIESFIESGITSAFGLLGTDGFSRSMHNLIAKTKGLRNEGFNAYALSGSYQVPQQTLFPTIQEDLMLVEEIIGSGEIAISDHRSSTPSQDALAQILSNTHVGGLLSGKAGITNIHVGSGKFGLQPLIDVLKYSDVPAKKVLPTHINRSHSLLKEGINYSKTFNAPIDFTAYFGKDDELSAHNAFVKALDEGVDLTNIFVSSDGQGSLPVFSDEGAFLKMGIGKVSSLFAFLKKSVKVYNIPLEDALHPITSNVATLFKLSSKGRLEKGYDADLLIIDESFNIRHVFINGKPAMQDGKVILQGTFSS